MRLSFGPPPTVPVWLYCRCGATFEKWLPIRKGINLPSVISLVGGLSSAATYSTRSFIFPTARETGTPFSLYKKAGAIYTGVINCGDLCSMAIYKRKAACVAPGEPFKNPTWGLCILIQCCCASRPGGLFLLL